MEDNTTNLDNNCVTVCGWIQGMRGKMPTNCLYQACYAFCIGLVLFTIGFVMSYMGFEADGVFTSNSTAVAGGRAYFYEDARGANIKFSKLSYAGPIVMGVGGFIIVASCVMTFEARDSAAKVGPAAFVATEEVTSTPFPVLSTLKPRMRRCIEVCTVGTQTTEHHGSFDTLHSIHLFDKKHLLETFRKFSRTVRQSSSTEDDIHRYPSAPNLFDEEDIDSSKPSVPQPAALAVRRSSCLPKFKNRVPPVLIKQARSIDCSSSSPFLPIAPRPSTLSQSLFPTSERSNPMAGSCSQIKMRKGIHKTTGASATSDIFMASRGGSGEATSPASHPTSRATSVDISGGAVASGTGTVDLHLPNGMVTLNVIHTTGGSVLGGSSHCLRTLSPHPSYHSQSDDSSFDMGSVKSDNVLIPKSPMKPYKYRSESFGGRPSLVRQSKVDQAEVVYIPDSDDETQEAVILEAEHETDSDSN